MARATLTKTNAPGGYAAAGVAVTMTAADASNLNQFVANGNDVIIIQNSGAGAHTWTLTSTVDSFGRLGTITTESIAAGAIRVFGPLPLPGWVQSDGKVYLQADHAEVKFGIIQLPG
ncbi:MAG: hypothetical protein ACOYM3_01135 [Terrimicrobiaceae bacterium]